MAYFRNTANRFYPRGVKYACHVSCICFTNHCTHMQACEFLWSLWTVKQCKLLLKLKDNRQTTARISHNLIQNNKLALSSTTNLHFSFASLKKLFFYHKSTPGHLIPSVQKPNYWIDVKVSANCENLQRYGFASRVKVSQLQKKIPIENHQSQPTSMTFWTKCEINTEEHCLWLAHFLSLSDALSR